MPVGLASGTEECRRQFREKTRKQHYLSILVERLIGKDPKAIGESLGMTEASVLRDLEYVRRNWSLIFSPDGSGNAATRKVKCPSSTSRIKMLEAKCEGCGVLIPKGVERVVLAAFAVGYRTPDYDDPDDFDDFDEDGDAYATGANLRSVGHYCDSCRTAKELCVHNPWRLHSDATPEQIDQSLELMKKCEAEGLAESAAEGEDLNKAVAAGDMHAFNRKMPTTPKRNDVMARAVEFSQIMIRQEGEDPEAKALETHEISDMLASTETPDRPSAYLHRGEALAAGEASQRARVLAFLKCPASRGKFTTNKRNALRIWAEGASQMEAGRRCAIDQGNFSRIKNAALAMAYKT